MDIQLKSAKTNRTDAEFPQKAAHSYVVLA